MLWRILKTILRLVTIQAHFRDGDIIHLVITLGGNVVLDREVDIIPGA